MRRISWLLFLFLVSIRHVPAQERSGAVLADWMASSSVRTELKITEVQEKEILGLINRLRLGYRQFFDEHPLPDGKYAGPRAELIADAIPEFQKVRNELLAEFESKLMEVLDPVQGEQLLGRLIQASGARSMVESPELRKRLKLTKEQIVKLEQIYIAPQDAWQDEMHRGDKLQDVDDPEVMLEKQYEYSVLRSKIVAERIWKIREAIDKAQDDMDDLAMRTINPEQKLIYDDLESAPPKPKKPKEKGK